MTLLDKLLIAYLKPLWFFYCVAVFVQDKMSGTNMRKSGISADGLTWFNMAPFTFMFFIPALLYIMVIPTFALRWLPHGNALLSLYFVLFIVTCIYAIFRYKSIGSSFRKPRFLGF